MRITVHYQSLTANQAEQIAPTLTADDDPYRYAYRIDTQTGVVVGRYVIEPQEVKR